MTKNKERCRQKSSSFLTYDKRPRMKRDARQKSSLFLRKGLVFCRASLFIFSHLLYVTALACDSRQSCYHASMLEMRPNLLAITCSLLSETTFAWWVSTRMWAWLEQVRSHNTFQESSFFVVDKVIKIQLTKTAFTTALLVMFGISLQPWKR